MDSVCLAADKKKSHDNGWPLIFWDESGFSLVPILAGTWAEWGEVPVLYESGKRTSQTGIGFITITPKRRHLNFRFTIHSDAVTMDTLVFELQRVHRYYGKTASIVWDGLPAHKGVMRYFQAKHPDWFVFNLLPPYSPELNPVEPCWNEMKNNDLGNFVVDHVADLREAALAAAKRIDANADLLIPQFFKHSRLRL